MQRVRRKLRHRGLQTKLRAAPGARNSTQNGNIFLSRENKGGKTITRINHIEDKVPRRVANPYELGVKGQGYLLRGHDDEANAWGSARNSNKTKPAELKGELSEEETTQLPVVAKDESSRAPQGKPTTNSRIGDADKNAVKESIGTKESAEIRAWGDSTMEIPVLNDATLAGIYDGVSAPSTVDSPGTRDMTPTNSAGSGLDIRNGDDLESSGSPPRPRSKAKAFLPRTHGQDTGLQGNSTQLEEKADAQNSSAPKPLYGATSYPDGTTQLLSTDSVSAPMTVASDLVPPSAPNQTQPSPKEVDPRTTKNKAKEDKTKTKAVKGFKKASKNETALLERTGVPGQKATKATKATKPPTQHKDPPIPKARTPGTEGPSNTTTHEDYYQAALPDGFPEPKGGNKEFKNIEKKAKFIEDKARKWRPGDGKMKGPMKGPRQTLPPAESPHSQEGKHAAGKSAAIQKPRAKTVYPPKKEPSSDEVIKLSGKLKKSGTKSSGKEAAT